MKKLISVIIFSLAILTSIINVSAEESRELQIYLFHGDGCPHCAEEIKFLDRIDDEYNIHVNKYEVWYNSENEEIMNKVKSAYNISATGVPLTIIGDTYFVGYSSSSDNRMKRAIKYYLENEYTDKVKMIIDGTYEEDTVVEDNFSKEDNEDFSIDIPFFGNINLSNVSLISASVIIGFIDGFNPCAMWILLFLISVLISMKDKKRMIILGVSFLMTSALVYMLIMFSWLNIVISVSTSIIFRNIIAVVAIVGGLINLKSYLKSNDSGCEVVDDKKRKKIFSSIKKFTKEKSLLLALGGVVLLAISVNVIELACSAGLPLIFTQLLAINDVSTISGLYLTLIYIFFFLIDDLVVFLVAVFTMNATGISTKYGKYSHLIGGVLMLLIGILLIIKPELLMFNI